jgi:hypothetical protein
MFNPEEKHNLLARLLASVAEPEFPHTAELDQAVRALAEQATMDRTIQAGLEKISIEALFLKIPEAEALAAARAATGHLDLDMLCKRVDMLCESAMAAKPVTGKEIVPEVTAGKEARKAARDCYKAECKMRDVKVTDAMIAEAANAKWHGRTAIQKWLACDPRYDGEPDRLIRKVFTDRPHIPR